MEAKWKLGGVARRGEKFVFVNPQATGGRQNGPTFKFGILSASVFFSSKV